MVASDTHVLPGFLTPVLTQISFKSHRLLSSHAAAEVRGKNTPERNFASTGSQTHNYQIRSPTRSPLNHLGGQNSQAKIVLYSVKSLKSGMFLHKLQL